MKYNKTITSPYNLIWFLVLSYPPWTFLFSSHFKRSCSQTVAISQRKLPAMFSLWFPTTLNEWRNSYCTLYLLFFPWSILCYRYYFYLYLLVGSPYLVHSLSLYFAPPRFGLADFLQNTESNKLQQQISDLQQWTRSSREYEQWRCMHGNGTIETLLRGWEGIVVIYALYTLGIAYNRPLHSSLRLERYPCNQTICSRDMISFTLLLYCWQVVWSAIPVL